MPTVEYETGTLADAIANASRVAPTRGEGFDKARGISIEVNPVPDLGKPSTLVRATDLAITYSQRITSLAVEGAKDPFWWRVPSQLIAGYLSQLPSTAGSRVRLIQKDDAPEWLYIRSGNKSVAKVRLMAEPLLEWPWFDDSDMVVIPGFGACFDQVAWACDRDKQGTGAIISGVHIDGEYLLATDTVVGVSVKCPVSVEKPITSPIGTARSLLRGGDVRIKASDDRRLQMMPDDDTQITSTVLVGEYPQLRRVIDSIQPAGKCVVPTKEFVESIQRMMVLVKGERYPRAQLRVAGNLMEIRLSLDEVGTMQESIELEEQHEGQGFKLWFTPQKLVQAAENCQATSFTIEYPGRVAPVRISAGADYTVMLAPHNVQEDS